MLATDFHIMDRKISMGYWKRKSHYKSFDEQHAVPFFLILWRYNNDINNQPISNQIISNYQILKKCTNKDIKNAFARKYTNRIK